MLENIEVLNHSAIKISKDKVIYIDPFKIEEEFHDADIIMITHDHYDHYSEEDIKKVVKEDTIIVITEDLVTKVLKFGINPNNIVTVEPNMEYLIDNIKIKTVPAYNINKAFHPKSNGWVGYVLIIEGISYYIAGDTDITSENLNVKCDVAFVPVGGTYTMDYSEAAKLVNCIMPKIAVPTHYGSIVGTRFDGPDFIKLLNYKIEGKILLKE